MGREKENKGEIKVRGGGKKSKGEEELCDLFAIFDKMNHKRPLVSRI